MLIDTEELRERMALEPITAGELAHRVGVSRQSMYNIMAGRSQPRPTTLKAICRELRCTPPTLMLGCGGPSTEYQRQAGVMIERYTRELDGYDVRAAALDYASNYLASHYGELTKEQYETARSMTEQTRGEFAEYMQSMFECFEILGVADETRAQAVAEALSTFTEETLPTMIDPLMDDE